MNTKKAVHHCIESEDKRNPYTDEKIADILSLYRENVTNIRKELNIPDSRVRRKNELTKIIGELLNENTKISDRALTKILNDQNYVIGKYAVAQIRQQLCKDEQMESHQDYEEIFSKVIGFNGTLKNTIKRVIAAISYPPHGMHTLIRGQYGCGKSMFIETMIEYAKTLDNFMHDAPFMQINCNEYKDYPDELLSIVFGYVQDNSVYQGCLEELDGGFLYLKNMEDFPIHGKELMIKYLDSQCFMRMNQKDVSLKSNVLILASTTTKNEDYSIHFPMVVELPSFDTHPVNERLEYIKSCFISESQHLGYDLTVKKDCLMALVKKKYAGNYTQVRSEIKMICAKAFLEKRLTGANEILISYEILSDMLKQGNLLNKKNKEYEAWIRGDMIIVASSQKVFSRSEMSESWDIYQKLEERIRELRKSGVDNKELSVLLTKEIEYSLSKQIRSVEQSKMSVDEISIIVGEEILQIAQSIYERAKRNLPYLSESIVFPLAIHLNMIHMRQKNNNSLKILRELGNIKANSPNEYLIAKDILLNIKEKLTIHNIEEEMVFLTVYLQKFQNRYTDETKRIAVLVVTHGRVASAMAETANIIMGEQHANGLDLEFQDSPQVMCEKVIAKVNEINQGKGCIILADMGSLLQLREKVERELGIHVGILGRVDTLLVIECVRKTLWTNESLDEIIASIDYKNTMNIYENQNKHFTRQKAILTCCITGEGAAIQLEEYLRERFEAVFNQIHWLHIGYINDDSMRDWLEQVSKEYEIVACVGTMNPHLNDLPFYSAEEIYTKAGLSALKKYCIENVGMLNPLEAVLNVECITIADVFMDKNKVIDEAVSRMVALGYVSEEFLLSVYKREAYYPTYLKERVAIPHGEIKFITKPVIHITKLVRSTAWDNDNEVDFVFTIALSEPYVSAIEELYKRIKKPDFMLKLKDCKTSEEILNLFLSNTVLVN